MKHLLVNCAIWIVVATSGCSGPERLSEFATFLPGHEYLYALTDTSTGGMSTVRVSTSFSASEVLVRETIQPQAETKQSDGVRNPTGLVEYRLKMSNDEVVQQTGDSSVVLLRNPVRSGAPAWTNRRVILGTASNRETDETCHVGSRGKEDVLGKSREVVGVRCQMTIDDMIVRTDYSYAHGLGLIRRTVVTLTTAGSDLGGLVMALKSVKPQ